MPKNQPFLIKKIVRPLRRNYISSLFASTWKDLMEKRLHVFPGGLIRFGIVSQGQFELLAQGRGAGVGKTVVGTGIHHHLKIPARR
jgi:hypothetical protein